MPNTDPPLTTYEMGNDYVGHMKNRYPFGHAKTAEVRRPVCTPPDVIILPDSCRSNRDTNFDRGASGANNDTDVEIGPGFFCGLALERVGTTILHRAKVSMLLAKPSLYQRMVNPDQPHRNTRQLCKPLYIRAFGIIVQESADLIRYDSSSITRGYPQTFGQ
ncbi:hypothetical protein BU17DRAFT_97381 [Hysterangium stoloniferum]|nr:hypothetical protein BU17DRAFT_97381 [Hysterangium stoloniferum]